MAEDFGEYVVATDTIAAILGTYPFSIGIFRELIQNSDDAKAAKQVFVLDWRNHPKRALFDPKLGKTQGPALLAHNGALFSDDDWEALKSIHRSSKKTDTSKIGKYGIGFRSCYHITDHPQILSGTSLAILDPQHDFSPAGGVRFDFTTEGERYFDQLLPFDFFLPRDARRNALNGSVIRLPLRTGDTVSAISSKVVKPAEIRSMLDDFIREELGIALLFLRHVKEIEIWEVSSSGERLCLAKARMDVGSTGNREWNVGEDAYSTCIVGVSTEVRIPSTEVIPETTDAMAKSLKNWRLLRSKYPQANSASLISYHLDRDTRLVLSRHKLFPDISMAVPLDGADWTGGRLFTYLPLPIRTGFSCHVHGLFALTQSRQNLSNVGEIGIVRGSDDNVLVEWNRILFDIYLPKAWVTLLPILLEHDEFGRGMGGSIWHFWPPVQAQTQTGDGLYWKDLPMKVLTTVIKEQAPVWPLFHADEMGTGSQFGVLTAALVAAEDSRSEGDMVLRALARAGLRIVWPPGYLLELMENNQEVWYTSLTPGKAHSELLNHIPELEEMGKTHPQYCLALLAYLVSANAEANESLSNIIRLPIVPLTGEGFAAVDYVTSSSKSGTVYTVFEQSDFDVWSMFDSKAVALFKCPKEVAHRLRQAAGKNGEERRINLRWLTPEKVVEYLKIGVNPFGLRFIDGIQGSNAILSKTAVDWLSKFWVWVRFWTPTFNEQLLPLVGGFYLLPTQPTGLGTVDRGIVSESGLNGTVIEALKELGVVFLHESFSTSARQALEANINTKQVLWPASDVHAVLDRIERDLAARTMNSTITAPLLAALLSYFVRYVPEACRLQPLNAEQRDKLRSLMIWLVLVPSPAVIKPEKTSSKFLSSFGVKQSKNKNTTKAIASLPCDSAVHGVTLSIILYLPVLEDAVFLDGSIVDLAVLPYLEPSHHVPLTDVAVLELALGQFIAQSKFLQNAFMEYMVHNKDSLPPRILKSLQQVEFIPVLDGSVQAPGHVIDPKSLLIALFSESASRLPRILEKDAEGLEVVLVLRQLRALGLLRDTLTLDIVTERIQFISSSRVADPKGARALAIKLFDMLYSSAFDCAQLEPPVDAKWVPTNRGLVGYEECLDRGTHRPELWDEVFASVEENIKTSHSLRLALGWDKPIPLSVLTKQLQLVIDKHGVEHSYRKPRALIKELSQRDLSDEDVRALQTLTEDKLWIPISSGKMATTSRAVFQLPIALKGIYEIPATLSERPEIRSFLSRMGCTERPTTALLNSELKKYQQEPPAVDSIGQVLLLLRSLPSELTEEERDTILVPDVDCRLWLAKEVYFNDIGDRAFLEAGDLCLAHPSLDDNTAKHLRLRRLGLKYLHLKSPAYDMGEKLTTTIRNVLKQYTEQQVLNELLANACDARATEFKILVDEKEGPINCLLSPAMASFQTCPSLVVYNNSVFTPKDFEGICRTGIGGKDGRSDTIGQFGLGSLAMFHLSEMVMIVSADKVLFLDPSKTHLPFEDWASLLLPISQVKRLYADHLATLDGLFGFSLASTDRYMGTIFRMPLRSSLHISSNSILQTIRTPEYVLEKIIRPYWKQAKESLLFTKIDHISTFYRNRAGHLFDRWSISAERVVSRTDGEFVAQTVHIISHASSNPDPLKDEWETVMASRILPKLPSELTPLIEPHRLRSPILLGFAACIGQKASTTKYHLFSTLPLPMQTTLPLHLTASFILTPDRRHIRFDDLDNLESKYNRWLLSTMAAPVYLFALEHLLRLHGSNVVWWPGNTTQQDNVTRILVDRFYSPRSRILLETQRLMCSSLFTPGHYLIPSDVVMMQSTEPPEVTKILSLLRVPHLISLPPIIRERCSGVISSFEPSVVALDIQSRADIVMQLYKHGQIELQDIQSLLQFLVQDPSLDPTGLPLLPLVNGTLATIQSKFRMSEVFYIWKPLSPSRTLFDPASLIHLEFNLESIQDKQFNIEYLSAKIVPELIKKRISPSPSIRGMSEEDQRWVADFWEEYSHLDPAMEMQIDSFPLFCTLQPDHYVSRDACYNQSDIIVVKEMDPDWLCEALMQFGASLVRRDDPTVPKARQDLLRSLPSLSIQRILKFLEPISRSALGDLFFRLAPSIRHDFAELARRQLVDAHLQGSLISTAKNLPIWPVSPDDPDMLCTAWEVKMLPSGISHQVGACFMRTPTTEFSLALKNRLGIPPLTMGELWQNAVIPAYLYSTEDQQAYRRLLVAVISSDFGFSSSGEESMLVPNGNRKLVLCKTMYNRDPLFVAAFGSDSKETFLLEEFRDLAPRLAPFGLKTQNNIDFETFKICATAFSHDLSGPDRISRAAAIYEAYMTDLPVRVGPSDDEAVWRELDNLRFIPRAQMRQRSMRLTDASPYVVSLPDVISPVEGLLPEYEAVAWTQRAIFATRPTQRVLIVNPTLGMPTPSDVVKHLRVLALEFGRDQPGNLYLLLDLEATYKWLDENSYEVAEVIINHHDEPLFLNVDDPRTDAWAWCSADDMFFNISEAGNDLKAVRKFLVPFKDFLYVAGVEEIVNPPKPEIAPPTSHEVQMLQLRNGFNEMRLNGKLTDVVLISDDEGRFPAHRALLATMSEYFRDLFCGEFTEAGPGTTEDPVEVEVDYSSECLKAVLDYTYLGSAPDIRQLDDLLDMLDLSQYWGFMELNEMTQVKIIEGSHITPRSYEEVSERATTLNCKLVIEACEFFARENHDAIQRLKGKYKGPRKQRRPLFPKEKTILAAPEEDVAESSNSPVGLTEASVKSPKRVQKLMGRLSRWTKSRGASIPKERGT